MSLEISGEKVSLSLNGEQIYLRDLDGVTGRHFGFYYDRSKTAAQIRNVVLTGDWPEKLSAEELGNLVAFE